MQRLRVCEPGQRLLFKEGAGLIDTEHDINPPRTVHEWVVESSTTGGGRQKAVTGACKRGRGGACDRDGTTTVSGMNILPQSLDLSLSFSLSLFLSLYLALPFSVSCLLIW